MQFEKPFVCSQTTTVFDNLMNQTFTVVNKLQLSQYSDLVDHGKTVRSISSNINLYACIVDADIRHNYATLGVHFREAPSKIPQDISKRLQAQSAFLSMDQNDNNFDPVQKDVESFTNFDLFRENHFHGT